MQIQIVWKVREKILRRRRSVCRIKNTPPIYRFGLIQFYDITPDPRGFSRNRLRVTNCLSVLSTRDQNAGILLVSGNTQPQAVPGCIIIRVKVKVLLKCALKKFGKKQTFRGSASSGLSCFQTTDSGTVPPLLPQSSSSFFGTRMAETTQPHCFRDKDHSEGSTGPLVDHPLKGANCACILSETH